jgi:hypothetical protein
MLTIPEKPDFTNARAVRVCKKASLGSFLEYKNLFLCSFLERTALEKRNLDCSRQI